MLERLSLLVLALSCSTREAIVLLVHYIVQEFYERIRVVWLPNTTPVIAPCLTHLPFNAFSDGRDVAGQSFQGCVYVLQQLSRGR